MKQTVILFAFIVFVFQSCVIAKFGSQSATPMLLNHPNGEMILVKHVKVKKHKAFSYGTFYDPATVLKGKMKELHPDVIINTSITVKRNIANSLLNYITLGIANSKMVIVECDFMKNKYPI